MIWHVNPLLLKRRVSARGHVTPSPPRLRLIFPRPMLDLRIYRTSWLAVVLAAIVTAFALRQGMANGAIVVVAHRDALGSPAVAEQSGTGVLLDLGRVLSGETLHHTIVLVSTTGSSGTAGAAELASSLGRPIDAVLVLG